MSKTIEQDRIAIFGDHLHYALRELAYAVAAIKPNTAWRWDIWDSATKAQRQVGDAMFASVSARRFDEARNALELALVEIDVARGCCVWAMERRNHLPANLEMHLQTAEREIVDALDFWARNA